MARESDVAGDITLVVAQPVPANELYKAHLEYQSLVSDLVLESEYLG